MNIYKKYKNLPDDIELLAEFVIKLNAEMAALNLKLTELTEIKISGNSRKRKLKD